MNKTHKIAFIGRKQGTSHKKAKQYIGQNTLERPRKNEEMGLENSLLCKVDSFSQANYCYIRINPEQVNKRTLNRIIKAESEAKKHCKIINSTSGFIFQSNKTECYKAWEREDINCPKNMEISPWSKRSTISNIVVDYIKLYGGAYIRTNNEDSGKGIYHVTSETNIKAIYKAITKLRLRSLTNRVSASKILVIEPVKNKDSNNIHHVFRAHIVGDKIVGGYAIVGKEPVIHSKDVSIENWNSFLHYNKIFVELLKKPEKYKEIINAFKCTKTEIGAIEFFLIDNELCFLEVNPTWGGKHSFGKEDNFMKKINENSELNELFYVKKWLDSESYYKNLFDLITEEFPI